MTDSDTRTETWKPVPGAGYYMVSDRGGVRSITHTTKGRLFEGIALRPRRDGDGYLVVNITYDEPVGRKHGVSVARLVLLAHDPDGYAPGLEVCHGPGGQQDNRYPENLRWDTKEANRDDWRRDNPPKPKPPKVCPRCHREHRGKGKNCHECVVRLGIDAADLLADGVLLDQAEAALEYPAAALFTLAVRYGGARVVVNRDATVSEPTPGHVPSLESQLHRAIIRWKAWRGNSDAR
jgi:hypothetical protein